MPLTMRPRDDWSVWTQTTTALHPSTWSGTTWYQEAAEWQTTNAQLWYTDNTSTNASTVIIWPQGLVWQVQNAIQENIPRAFSAPTLAAAREFGSEYEAALLQEQGALLAREADLAAEVALASEEARQVAPAYIRYRSINIRHQQIEDMAHLEQVQQRQRQERQEVIDAQILSRERALALLRRYLTPSQRQMLAARNAFLVIGSNNQVYLISAQSHVQNIYRLVRGQVVERHCAHIRDTFCCPISDHLLAQKVMLETDALSFHRLANSWATRHENEGFDGNDQRWFLHWERKLREELAEDCQLTAV